MRMHVSMYDVYVYIYMYIWISNEYVGVYMFFYQPNLGFNKDIWHSEWE